MQQKKEVIEPEQSESSGGKTAKIEAISGSGNIKVALKSKPSGGSATVQSIEVERQAKAARSDQEAAPKAVPFPKQARIHETPQPAAAFGPATGKMGVSQNSVLIIAAAAVGIVILGLVGLGVAGSDGPQATASLTATAEVGDASSAIGTVTASQTALQVTKAAETSVEPLSASDQMIAKMTAGTLAALRGKPASEASTPEPAATAAETAAVSALYNLVITAVSQGQSETYIDQLVNDAYANAQIAVPKGLILADGRVDTKAILALFVAE